MTAQTVEPTTIPRVNGRHQDKALARARKTRAIELRMRGLTYQQIADEMGYANAGSVYSIIQKAQAAELGERAAERRELEASRLDALQLALWPSAMAGDVEAVRQCTAIILARIRLLGLAETRSPVKGRQLTCLQEQMVVQEPECTLAACLVHSGRT